MNQEVKIPLTRIMAFRRGLLKWFAGHGRDFPWRKKSARNYQRILAEVFLQRTRAETVAKFLPGLLTRYPSWERLSKASEADLQDSVKPFGLWRRRAASLYLLAQEMGKRRGHFPRNRGEIEMLPGVGQYIANAILLFCYQDPHPLLDANMARVLERYFGPRQLADIRDDPYLQSLAMQVVNCNHPERVNWAILDLAALVCETRKPLCVECPLRSACRYFKSNE
jgi:A/G-specific adenine glycosylase